MSDAWLTPVAPGTVAPECLDRVRGLHTAVRDWIERTAVAQRNEYIRANLPYVDLAFAFGFATLGDHPTANKLMEDARQVMEGPIPEGGSPQADQEVTAAVVRNFLFRALRYRVEQARSGKPHAGLLSAEVLAAHEKICARSSTAPINNPDKLATHVIGRFRLDFRLLEPEERVDPYLGWTQRGDALMKTIGEWYSVYDPIELSERIRKAFSEEVPSRDFAEVRFLVLREALMLSGRLSEPFILEMLGWVPGTLLAPDGNARVPPDQSKRQGELLERAFLLAAHYRRADAAQRLIGVFTSLVRTKPEDIRPRFVNVVAPSCLRTLRTLGLSQEAATLLTTLDHAVLGTTPLSEYRRMNRAKPERWAAVLRAAVNTAVGWSHLGRAEPIASVLALARGDLLNPNAPEFQPTDFTSLARTYVTALGSGAGGGVGDLTSLFRDLNPAKISNTWTTAHYDSRFHLELVEDTVFAVCRLCSDDPRPAVVSA